MKGKEIDKEIGNEGKREKRKEIEKKGIEKKEMD